MAMGICFDLKVGQFLLRSPLEFVMLVNNGRIKISASGRAEEEPKPLRHVDKAVHYASHNYHPLPRIPGPAVLLLSGGSSEPILRPENLKSPRSHDLAGRAEGYRRDLSPGFLGTT